MVSTPSAGTCSTRSSRLGSRTSSAASAPPPRAPPPRLSHVERCLGPRPGPVVAATDYVKLHADSIRPFVPHRYVALGTDGFGRSDTRRQLRGFFEGDRRWGAVAALNALRADGG